jgi:hypothetical protein
VQRGLGVLVARDAVIGANTQHDRLGIVPVAVHVEHIVKLAVLDEPRHVMLLGAT